MFAGKLGMAHGHRPINEPNGHVRPATREAHQRREPDEVRWCHGVSTNNGS